MNIVNDALKLLKILFNTVFHVDLGGIERITINVSDEDGQFKYLYLKNGKLVQISKNSHQSTIFELLKEREFRKLKEVLVLFNSTESFRQYVTQELADELHFICPELTFLELKIPANDLKKNRTLSELKKYFSKNDLFVQLSFQCTTLDELPLIDSFNDVTTIDTINVRAGIEFLFDHSKIWQLDDIYYRFRTTGIPICFKPLDLSFNDGKLYIKEVELTEDEIYNLSLYIHKYLNETSLRRNEKSYFMVLKELLLAKKKVVFFKYYNIVSKGLSYKPSFRDYINEYTKAFWLRAYHAKNADKIVRYSKLFLPKAHFKNIKRTVFIVGWYGTETVGDKAILGGIVEDYIQMYGENNVEFIIGSLYPYISERTVIELGIKAKVVNTQNFDLVKYSAFSDEVVMGGGPLMDLHYLYVPLIGFLVSKSFKKRCVVYGCGLGPLKSAEHIEVVKRILSISDKTMLRDSDSVKLAKKWGGSEIELWGDPARSYLISMKDKMKFNSTKNEIACFLREMPNSFYKHMSQKEFQAFKEQFELALRNFLVEKMNEYHAERIVLYHMHNFDIGGDDRDYSRYFIERYFSNNRNIINFDPKLSTVNSICKVMLSSKLNICMRFHSMLFADTLETNFFAVDYTDGGKIKAYLSDHNKLELLHSISSLVSSNKPNEGIL